MLLITAFKLPPPLLSILLLLSLLLVESTHSLDTQEESLFYQVMGAVRCPKIKKHAGIKLRPINKAKEPFTPGDMLIYSCESSEFTQSIKCLDDGRWNEIPHCPDPSNSTCPDLGPVLHGTYNASGPYKVGTVVAFRCDNEFYNIPSNNSTLRKSKDLKDDNLNTQQQSLDGQKYTIPTTTINANINEVDAIPVTTLATPRPFVSPNPTPSVVSPLPSDGGSQLANLVASETTTSTLKYNLTGHRLLRCLPSSKWNHPLPTCTPVLPEPASNFNLMLTSAFLILVPIVIFIAIMQLFVRWRKKQQQRARWKQYFTDYKYRHSKTSITFGSRPQSSSTTIPVTDL